MLFREQWIQAVSTRMDEESLILHIEDMSKPVVEEGESVVQLSPYEETFDNHLMPEWAYLRLISEPPQVFTSSQASDFLRVCIAYKSCQEAGTLISRICELENPLDIERITFPSRESSFPRKFAVIAHLRYPKDNIDALLYLIQDLDVIFLEPTDVEHISITK